MLDKEGGGYAAAGAHISLRTKSPAHLRLLFSISPTGSEMDPRSGTA